MKGSKHDKEQRESLPAVAKGAALTSKHAGQNITDAIFAVADAINNLATQVKYLGNGDAATRMGAIEAFGMHLGEKIDGLTAAIQDVREHPIDG